MQRAFEKIVEELEVEKTMAYKTYETFEMKVDLGRAFGAEKAIEVVNQVATEYFKENYFNLDNTKLHDCPKCGEKATHRVNKKGSWACGCFKCGLFKSSYDHAKAIQAWEDYCGEYGGGWIPVSSGKLPEESGEYYTYVYYDGHYMYSIDEIDCDGIIKEWNCSSDYKIIAWKPIEPYKAESEE